MSDHILSVEDAHVIIGGQALFKDLNFNIHRNQKIALVGKNGAGKTTLMNIITGDRELDDGTRWTFPGITIGYMQQQIDPIPGQSVVDFVFQGLEDNDEGWDQTYKIEMIIEPLDLKPEDKMDKLSGGQLRRAALARALVEEHDILMLDEPTNHLDLDVILWLEGYLKHYPGTILCVSHDRSFLATVTDKVFWLDRGSLKVSPSGFADFETWSQELLDQEARELHNRSKKVEQEMEWATRGVKARRKRNVRRAAQAHADKAQLEKDISSYRRVISKIELPAPAADESSKIVAEFFNTHKSFQDPDTGAEKVILEKFNMRIKRGERIGLMGKNGSGKTTFLKMLTGEIQPDMGRVKRGKTAEFSYFDQKRADLKLDETLQNNLCPAGSDHLMVRGKMRHVCGYLKDFLFDPQDAWRNASTLSGGQKNRLLLAKVLADPKSFLILDEPTNDLDMDTLDMLEDILKQYDGTLFLVSHDRDFLDQTVDKLLVFEGDGKIEGIVGGYSDYVAFKKLRDEKKNKKPKASQTTSSPETNAQSKDNSKNLESNSAQPAQPVKMTYKLKYELENLPDKISALTDEVDTLETKLKDPYFYNQDPDGFKDASVRFEKAKEELDEAETRWLELEEMRMAAG